MFVFEVVEFTETPPFKVLKVVESSPFKTLEAVGFTSPSFETFQAEAVKLMSTVRTFRDGVAILVKLMFTVHALELVGFTKSPLSKRCSGGFPKISTV